MNLSKKIIEMTRGVISKTSDTIACYVLFLQAGGDTTGLRNLLKQAKVYTAENRGSVNKMIKTAEFISAEYAEKVSGVTADSEGIKALARFIKSENLTYSRFKRESAKKAESVDSAKGGIKGAATAVSAVADDNIDVAIVAEQFISCLATFDAEQFGKFEEILQVAGFSLQKTDVVKRVA